MSRGGEAGHSGSPAGWRGGEARPARPTRGTAGSEVSPARDPTAPRAPGERTGPPPSSAGHGDRCPFNPQKPVPRPPPTPQPRSAAEPRPPGACQPAATTTTHPATPGGSGGWEGRVTGRLPGVRLRVKGAGRDAHTGPGVGAGGWTGVPGGHRAHPRPGRLPGARQADAVQPSPHLISRRVHAAASGGQKKKSVQLSRRGKGTQEPQPRTPSPPASRGVRESARDSPSRAAVLPSNQAARPPVSTSALGLPSLLSLSPSLPPISSSPPGPASPAPSPPLRLRPRGVGGDSEKTTNRKKGLTPPLAPSL